VPSTRVGRGPAVDQELVLPAGLSRRSRGARDGNDFVDLSTAAVGSCDVLLALPGDQRPSHATEITPQPGRLWRRWVERLKNPGPGHAQL
jgi:hypothetical protein